MRAYRRRFPVKTNKYRFRPDALSLIPYTIVENKQDF